MRKTVQAPTHQIVPDGRAPDGAAAASRRLREGFRAPPDSRAMAVRCKTAFDGPSEPKAAHAG